MLSLRWAPRVVGALALALAAGCGSSAPCDARALQRRLDAATPGSTVTMGACRLEGSILVPPGVTLAGQGTARSILVAGDGVGVCLEPGPEETLLRDLSIESAAVSAVAVCRSDAVERAAGSLAVENVEIRLMRGWGFFLDGVGAVRLSDVAVHGPITADNEEHEAFRRVIGELPAEPGTCPTTPQGMCTPGTTQEIEPADCAGCGRLLQYCDACERWATVTAVEGIALRRTGGAELADVRIDGLARGGATFVDAGNVTWDGGSIARTLGTGVYASITTPDRMSLVAATDVTVDATFASIPRAASSTAVYVEGARLETDGFTVTRSEGYGIIHVRSAARHTGLTVTGSANAGLWYGDGTELLVDGAMLDGNRFAGMVAAFSSGITVRDTTVTGTRNRPSQVAMVPMALVTCGDGVQLRGSLSAVRLERVRLQDNERVGLLVDLGFADHDIVFEGVTVNGTGEQLGAIAGRAGDQLMTVAPGEGGWDTGITREGATVANDARVGALLDIVGVTAPEDFPRPDDAVGVTAPED